MRTVIVGAEEKKWTFEQIPKTKDVIYSILRFALRSMKVERFIGFNGDKPLWNNVVPITSDVVLVSGRCPVSKCDSCGRKSFSKNEDLIVGYVQCEFCHQPKKRRAGGVDIYAEEIADQLGITKEIYPAETNQWNDERVMVPRSYDPSYEEHDHYETRKGYRSRNIQIAEAGFKDRILVQKGVFDERKNLPPNMFTVGVAPIYRDNYVLYNLVPASPTAWCKHHKEHGHVSSGGCWTEKWAEKLRREVYKIVIA